MRWLELIHDNHMTATFEHHRVCPSGARLERRLKKIAGTRRTRNGACTLGLPLRPISPRRKIGKTCSRTNRVFVGARGIRRSHRVRR